MTHGIYPDDLASRLKDRVGKKYRPSNGTEGDIFMDAWCGRCRHDDYDGGKYCPIIGRTMAHEINEADYPTEWQYGDDGQPKCTAFELAANLKQ